MSYLVALLICLPALALSAVDWDLIAAGSFANIDQNGDGTLEKNEVEHYFRQTYDTNNDNKVTKAEYVAVLTAANTGDNNLVKALTDLFDDLDYNNDGALDKDDNDKLYDTIDANKNGHVTQVEFTTWFDLAIKPNSG